MSPAEIVASIVRGAAERVGLVGPRAEPAGQLERDPPRQKKPPTPIKPRNAKRAAARHAEAFAEQASLCRRRACLVPGCRVRPCVPHHERSRGAGGNDSSTVPLCWPHHDEAHHGQKTFEARYGLDLEHEAAKLAAELAARPAHDCEDYAVLRENAATLASRYLCGRCGGAIPDEQDGEDA